MTFVLDEDGRVEFAASADALAFVPGMRVEWRPPATRWERVWRWLTRRNYRVAKVDAGRCSITVERCRS